MAAKILVTGRPGVGKTTAVRAVLAAGIDIAGGFTTEEIRDSHGCRVGFQVTDLHSGAEGILAHVSRKGRPRVGRYGVDVACFNRIGVSALREALGRQGCIVIDEIGKMELCSDAFPSAVTAVIGSDNSLLATLPVYRHPFLDALRQRDDIATIEVTLSNRDELPPRLVEVLRPPGPPGAC